MTKEEARGLVGRAVLYSSGFGEPEKVVITEGDPDHREDLPARAPIRWQPSRAASTTSPSYLRRDQMPQGGWTETVAAGRVNLAATVAHVCELALSPEARPTA